MSGLNNPVVGTCSVAIATKMPWNDAGYQPPQVHWAIGVLFRCRCWAPIIDRHGENFEKARHTIVFVLFILHASSPRMFGGPQFYTSRLAGRDP